MMNKEEALRLLDFNYKNLKSPIAYASENMIYEYFKDHLTRSDIKSYLESIPEYVSQRKFVKTFKRNYVYTPRKRYLLMTDLKDISEISRSNKNMKFILIVIDSYT